MPKGVPIRLFHSTVAGTPPPAGSLTEGELALDALDSPPHLWTAVPTSRDPSGRIDLLDGADIGDALDDLTGASGTTAGWLNRNAAGQWVLSNPATLFAPLVNPVGGQNNYLATNNATATGTFTLGQNATLPLQAVAFRQLSSDTPLHTGPTAPPGPNVNDLWFDTTTNQLKSWNGSAWVVSTGAAVTGFLPLSGGTLTGRLNCAAFVGVSGDFQCNGQILAAKTGQYSVYCNGEIYCTNITAASVSLSGNAMVNGTVITPTLRSTVWQIDASNNYRWSWQGSPAFTMQWVSQAVGFWTCRQTDWQCFNAVGPVGGQGPYNNFSDIRAKLDVHPDERGLELIKQIQPINFERPPPPAQPADARRPTPRPRRELGFSAQALQPLLPEAVRLMGIELPDGSGGIDSAQPTLGVAETMLIPVLVNAVKQLAARVEELEKH